jgi:integrase
MAGPGRWGWGWPEGKEQTMKGSIREKHHKDGTLFYEVVMDFRDPATNKRLQPTKSFAKERDAKRYLATYQAEQDKGTEVQPSRLTLAELLQQWLDQYAKTQVGPKCYVDYEGTVRLHLIPALGGMKVQAIRANDLDKFYAAKLKAGASPTLIHKCHQRLVQALNYARKLGYIAVNHAEDATPPRVYKKEMKTWTTEQARRFLVVIPQSTYGYLWLVALGAGMRRGELLGLRWSDVDFARNTLQVNQTVGIEYGQATIKPMPKNDSSRRTVAIDLLITDALKTHRARQNEHRLQLGDLWEDNDLLFPSAVGTPIWPDNITRDYNRLVVAAEVPRIRIHDIRHTYATLALKHGANLLAVSKQLGHARVSTTTDFYGHIDSEMQRDASTALASALFGRAEAAM